MHRNKNAFFTVNASVSAHASVTVNNTSVTSPPNCIVLFHKRTPCIFPSRNSRQLTWIFQASSHPDTDHSTARPVQLQQGGFMMYLRSCLLGKVGAVMHQIQVGGKMVCTSCAAEPHIWDRSSSLHAERSAWRTVPHQFHQHSPEFQNIY